LSTIRIETTPGLAESTAAVAEGLMSETSLLYLAISSGFKGSYFTNSTATSALRSWFANFGMRNTL
jgi:hypothetical protein